jgi:hypothetical protein
LAGKTQTFRARKVRKEAKELLEKYPAVDEIQPKDND